MPTTILILHIRLSCEFIDEIRLVDVYFIVFPQKDKIAFPQR